MKIYENRFLVVTRFEVQDGHVDRVEANWNKFASNSPLKNAAFFKAVEDNEIAFLYEVDNFMDIQKLILSDWYKEWIDSLAPYLDSDVHQEVVGLVEEVRSRATFVPFKPYMQLRRIEVPLSGIEPYLEWRKRRIFEYVKKNEKVHSFLAFHSVFSTKPGVLFVTDYECDPVEFRESFLTPEYQQIIKEAGHDHIKGGLYTKEFSLLFTVTQQL